MPDAESKIAYCVTCEMSIGNPIQAAVHYRSRQHFNRRLQRGLPVTDLPLAEEDRSSANRHYINECLRRGIRLQQPNAAEPGSGIFLHFFSICHLHFAVHVCILPCTVVGYADCRCIVDGSNGQLVNECTVA